MLGDSTEASPENTCDAQKLLCKSCTHCRQLVYSEAQERSDDECLEFSGVNLENGFQRMDPPVRINVEEMPLRTDGKMTSTLFCVVLDVIPAMFLDM